jgi:hypothetical protein
VAALVGGLALAIPIASSRLAHVMWMSQALAWTAVGLACASRMFRARAWSGRLPWAVATALAMGQVAAAHLSNGLAMGLLIVSSYVVARAVVEVRAGRRWSQVAVLLAVLAVLGVLANLAVLLPRLAYLPRTTLGTGYRALEALQAAARGSDHLASTLGDSARPTDGLRFAVAPGLYLGAIPLGLSLGGFLARKRLALASAFAFSGAVSYLLAQGAVARAADSVEGWDRVLGAYTHEPFRFLYAVVPAIAVLGALGVQAWQEAERPARRLLVAAPGFAVWGILPLAFDARPEYLVAFAIGAAAGAVVLGISAVDRRLAPLVAVVLAVELTAAGWIGHRAQPRPRTPEAIAPLLHPVEASTVDLDAYLAPGPIITALGGRPGDRFMSLVPGRFRPRGYQRFREPADWGSMATVRAPLFALEEAQGYNPVQPIRLWRFVREAEPRARRSNQSFFVRPAPAVFDLLDVSSVVTGLQQPAPVTLRGRPIAGEDGWVLVDLPSNPPRASFPASWSVVGSLDEALDVVTERRFDPAATVVLEAPPSPAPAATTGLRGTATYRATGPQRAEIDVETPTGGVMLVRNSFDPNWHATVDGEPAPVLPADGFLQAVAVPPGRHLVVLSYDDPTIGLGVLASLATTVLTLGGALVLRRRERRIEVARGGSGGRC